MVWYRTIPYNHTFEISIGATLAFEQPPVLGVIIRLCRGLRLPPAAQQIVCKMQDAKFHMHLVAHYLI